MIKYLHVSTLCFLTAVIFSYPHLSYSSLKSDFKLEEKNKSILLKFDSIN